MGSVSLRRINKSFGPVPVLEDVDIDVPDGSFTVFVGPSGCGKSTLLRLVAGLEDATSGSIVIDGRTVDHEPPARRRIAMVFQSYALYPHMNVFDNMAFGLQLAKTSKAQIRERVLQAARILELEPLLDRLPKQLSGGQRQRVAIGRAITREPAVFLFDEPLSNLDAALRVQMRIEIANLHRELGATMIYVTHDQIEAMTLADQIVVLNAGRVEQIGPPLELYRNPCNLFVAGFIGSPKINTIAARVIGTAGGRIAVETTGGMRVDLPRTGRLAEGDAAILGIRPEHLVIDPDGPLKAEFVLSEHLGAETYVHVRTSGSERLVLRRDSAQPHDASGALSLRASDPEAWHLFDQDGTSVPRTTPSARP